MFKIEKTDLYEKTKDLTKVVDYIMEQTILGTT